MKPHVTRVLVSDPRKNDLGRDGSRNDRRDARELAELLYRDKVKSVYHGEHGLRTLKELARSYLTITRDLTRVMTRIKAIYRSWAMPCAGAQDGILFGYERVDFVGNPIIFDQNGEECSSKQQGPAILAPRSERELQGDIHDVRRAVADIRQKSENDENHQRGMRVTRRDAH